MCVDLCTLDMNNMWARFEYICMCNWYEWNEYVANDVNSVCYLSLQMKNIDCITCWKICKYYDHEGVMIITCMMRISRTILHAICIIRWQTVQMDMKRYGYVSYVWLCIACDLKGLPTGYSRQCKYDTSRWYWLTNYWNGSVSLNYDTGRWYWLTAYWNGSILLKFMQRNLCRSHIWLAMSPDRWPI